MKCFRVLFITVFLFLGCAQNHSVIQPQSGYGLSGAADNVCILYPERFVSKPPDMGDEANTCIEEQAVWETDRFASGSHRFSFFRVAEIGGNENRNGEGDEAAEMDEHAEVPIADPLESFNRAMFTFNDRLYFWVMKPVAQGYNKVVPERTRISVKRFFENLKFPVRFVNNLLQANFTGAASEFGRFAVNTLWGIGGFLDPASHKELDIKRYNADLGQTLGIYGVGQGFYIVWPVLGPSTARDTVEIVGDTFLDPLTYLNPWYAWLGTRAYEEENDVSLRLGDYEALKEAAIDPYVAMRSAYVQHRESMIRKRGAPTEEPKPEGKK